MEKCSVLEFPLMAFRESPCRVRDKAAEKPQRLVNIRTTAINTSTKSAAALVSEDKPLTDKQKAFVKACAEGNPIPTAMHLAGYNEQPSYGYRMMKMPNIKRALKKYQEEYAQAAELSRIDVMNMLKESYEMAKLMSEPASMVSAAREIGKMCGYYEPKKIQLDVNMTGAVRFEQLTDAELFSMIEKATREAAEAEAAEAEEAEEAEDGN